MAIQIREQLKRWFSRGKYPTEEQFADAFDSFVHKDDKIGTDSLAQEVLDTFNNKAEVEALAAEVEARTEADESLRDELDETRGVYGTNSRGPVVRDKDGNEVLELTDSGMVQIDYPEGGHEQPAIQINGDTVKVKDTEGVVRIEVNEEGVRLKAAPNDYGSGATRDTSEPEITLNKDNAGGVTIKGGSDTNIVLKPDRALLNSHSNGLGYKYGTDIEDQTLQIDLGSDTIVKAVTRLENEGVVNREENISVKTPNTVRGSHENIMQANGRRYILYHPGGTAQMLHSNPTGTDKNGNVTGKVFFLDSYHDGGNRLLEVTDEGDRTQGQRESHRVDLRCPGTGGGDGLRIERRYLPASGKETHFLDLMADGTDVLYSQIDDGPNGFDATTNVMVDGSDVVVGRCIRDSNGNDVERSVRIEAAGDHYVLQGWHTTDPNTGNEEYETIVMTDGVDILKGRKEYPTDGDRTYVTRLMNPDSDEVLRAEKRESSHTTLSVTMENNGGGELLEANYDLDDEQKHLSLKNNGDDVLVSNSRNGADSEVLLCNGGDTVLHAIIRTQDIGGTLQEQKEFSIGFLPDEIMISDPNRQQISLADYVGERIDNKFSEIETLLSQI